jgi:hypothetical protein
MAYGTTNVDTIQSSTTGTPVVFKDGSGTQIGTLCRAWVLFNGTGTVAIRASFNVSSITDNGTGDYTVNFTTSMSDANYSVAATAGKGSGGTDPRIIANGSSNPTTSAVRMIVQATPGSASDVEYVSVAIFR